MRALTGMVDATLPDARGIASFNRPGTITLLSTKGNVIQKLGPATREKVKPVSYTHLTLPTIPLV